MRTSLSGYRPKQHIDKYIKPLNFNQDTSSQGTVDLLDTTIPCTIRGLRWNFGVANELGITGGRYRYKCAWAIVRQPQGSSLGTLDPEGSVLYKPEKQVIAHGEYVDSVASGTAGQYSSPQFMIEGETKSMRKMVGGDKLVFVYKAVAINEASANQTGKSQIAGSVQFFTST